LLVLIPGLEMGGAERAICRLIAGLDRERLPVIVATFRPGGECLHFLPPDVPVKVLGQRRGVGRLRTVLALAWVVRQERIDLVYSVLNSANLVALTARLLGALRVPLAIGVRSDYRYGLRKGIRFWRLKRLLTRLLYPRADLILCVTEYVRSVLVEDFRVPPALCLTLGNLVPGPAEIAFGPGSTPALEGWLEDGIPLVLAVGRLDPVKRFDMLLEAFAILLTTRRARLLILGDGQEEERLSGQIEALGLTGQCRLGGRVPDPGPYMRLASCLAVTSESEGFPNVVAEALVCGLPVVCFETCVSVADMVRQADLGQVLRTETPEEMAGALLGHLDAGRRESRLEFGCERDGLRLGSTPDEYERAFTRVVGLRSAASGGLGGEIQP
jgi:glycosyltransferase involved in cell wall biosynthesis